MDTTHRITLPLILPVLFLLMWIPCRPLFPVRSISLWVWCRLVRQAAPVLRDKIPGHWLPLRRPTFSWRAALRRVAYLQVRWSGSQLELARVRDGKPEVLWSLDRGYRAQQWYRLKVVQNGDLIALHVDGAPIGRARVKGIRGSMVANRGICFW